MKHTIRMHNAGWLAVAGLIGVALVAPSAALATKPVPQHKVTICHATDSNTNPYLMETVDIASTGHLRGGHDTRHEGPIWDATLRGRHITWGDIIPSYVYGTFRYAGQNWTADGQEILGAGCETETPSQAAQTETPSQSVSPQGPASTPVGGVLGATGVPHITPPPTDTIGDATTTSGSSWRLVLLALAAMLAGIMVLTPATKRSHI